MSFNSQTAANSGRGHRVHQPSETRELRKAPRSDTIRMCDGTAISQRMYDHLRSTAHQKFRGSHRGCAMTVRQAIPQRQWELIAEWIEAHPLKAGNDSAQQDGLVAILIGYAARKRSQNTQCLFDEIVDKRTAHMLLPAG